MSCNNKHIWTMEQDEILIDYVKNHEPLYNIKCKNYRKTQMKLNLWRELASIIKNKTDTECINRWAYIRDYYVRRKEKRGTRSPGEAAMKRAKKLSFLDSCSSIKRSTITSSKENTQDDLQEDFNEDSENFTQEEEFASQSNISSQDINNVVLEISHANSKRPKHSNSQERIKLFKQIPEESGKCEEQDETDLFFLSMAKIVKKLPPAERVHVRIEIGTIVGKAELRTLKQQNNDYSRPTSADSGGSGHFTGYQNETFSASSLNTCLHTVSDNSTTVLCKLCDLP